MACIPIIVGTHTSAPHVARCYLCSFSYWESPHGVCWAELCDDLEVIDVPGDHFSLLRQDAQVGHVRAGDQRLVARPVIQTRCKCGKRSSVTLRASMLTSSWSRT